MYQIAVTDFSLHAITIKHFQNQYGTVWPTFSVLIVGLYNRRFRISTSTFILLHKCLLAYTSFVDSYLLLIPDTARQRTLRHPAVPQQRYRYSMLSYEVQFVALLLPTRKTSRSHQCLTFIKVSFEMFLNSKIS